MLTNALDGNCEEPNVKLKLQKSRINMVNGSAIGSDPGGYRVIGCGRCPGSWI
jgi:hypothetical protein